MNGGGPATQNGKAVVRWNATRHGISSPAPVIPSLEKREDWQEHRDGILDNLSPVGHLEFTLAERVALLSWRLHRVTRYETETIALSQEQVEEDIHKRGTFLRSFRESPYASTHPVDIRFEAKDNKKAHNALKHFPSLEPGKTLKGEDASSVVWGVLVAAQKAIGEEIDVEGLELPGVPDDAWIEELPAMKVADVRGCVESIARAASQDPEGLLEAATETARWEAVNAKGKAERTEAEIDVMRRERILPDDKTLEKISRYEAHLSRQLYHALHELENLQKHRITGEGVPLARLDVQGFSEG
ncbi:MAG: hypothetical protein CYG60_24075 [Actinobacteria bacterium]|nr:MAG: hypothetical protein CYG60_24075 [Actinomycetota bacterium]